MFIYNRATSRRILTPWGKEVRKRLIERQMTQKSLCETIRARGKKISQTAFNNMLFGISTQSKLDVVAEINDILSIPSAEENDDG